MRGNKNISKRRERRTYKRRKEEVRSRTKSRSNAERETKKKYGSRRRRNRGRGRGRGRGRLPLSGIPGEKGTGDLRKHPVAPCTKGESLDGKGNGGCPPDRKRVGQGDGAGEAGGRPFEARER